jgi:hypothetical protein
MHFELERTAPQYSAFTAPKLTDSVATGSSVIVRLNRSAEKVKDHFTLPSAFAWKTSPMIVSPRLATGSRREVWRPAQGVSISGSDLLQSLRPQRAVLASARSKICKYWNARHLE